ncbi:MULTISPECIES: hypothetical protein [Nocardia]|uniref:hypothetical protein n=1 Tax=Nocardia TaxID=1817 RepID=UPI000D68638B|nr:MULTISPECIES: hypothetical protein [Nocardia]
MKINDMIANLKRARGVVGDIDVKFADPHCTCCNRKIVDIQIVQIDEPDPIFIRLSYGAVTKYEKDKLHSIESVLPTEGERA